MNALLVFLGNSDKLRKFLFGYWLIIPVLFFAYAFLTAQYSGLEFRQLLNNATVALGFLNACMTLILALVLRQIHTENEHSEKIFAVYSTVQQLLVANIIGALLSYFLARSLWLAPREPFVPRSRVLVAGAMVLIGVLTLFEVLIMVNLVF